MIPKLLPAASFMTIPRTKSTRQPRPASEKLRRFSLRGLFVLSGVLSVGLWLARDHYYWLVPFLCVVSAVGAGYWLWDRKATWREGVLFCTIIFLLVTLAASGEFRLRSHRPSSGEVVEFQLIDADTRQPLARTTVDISAFDPDLASGTQTTAQTDSAGKVEIEIWFHHPEHRLRWGRPMYGTDYEDTTLNFTSLGYLAREAHWKELTPILYRGPESPPLPTLIVHLKPNVSPSSPAPTTHSGSPSNTPGFPAPTTPPTKVHIR